jgi:hypothetical protein
MGILVYKENSYTFKDLFELNKKSIYYKTGEVIDLDTAETFDISEIHKYRKNYISEIMTDKEKENMINYKDNQSSYNFLEEKYRKKTITKDEMYLFLQYKNQNKIIPNYNYTKGYIVVNLNKIPGNLSDADYGKFHKMLSFLSNNHYNRLSYNNQYPISKKDMAVFLGYKKLEYFNKYLRNLKKHKLLDEQIFGGVKYLIINPAYAKKNMEIDSTVYKIFKGDLDECLTEEQIYYLNMYSDVVEIESMIPIQE